MNKIAEATSNTALATIQSTACLAEIGDRGELAVDWPRRIPAGIQRITRFLRGVFVFESCVDVANKMVIIIITNHNFLDFSKFTHLAPEVLVKGVEMVLQLAGVHFDLGIVGGVLV